MSKIRILFLGAGPAMPSSSTPYNEKFACFSKYFSGDIITPVESLQDMSIHKIGNFNFHPFLYYRGNSIIRNFLSFYYLISKAIVIYYKQNKYDVIITPNPLFTGIIALCIKMITRVKIIVEIHGNFEVAFKYNDKSMGLGEKMKEKISAWLIPFVLKKVDAIKLLYKGQIDSLNINLSNSIIVDSFPDFVPISEFFASEINDKHYVLLLGYPWYLKGVDILIKAFNQISGSFPEHRLKVVGWCPEGREFFEDLAKDNPRIDLCDPVYYEEVVKLMSECTLYVLASRTEGIARVLMEAMICGKPVVASNVGGISTIVKDGYNGLLFEKENVDELARKMRLILSDSHYAETMGMNGCRYVQENLSEECFLNNYIRFIQAIPS